MSSRAPRKQSREWKCNVETTINQTRKKSGSGQIPHHINDRLADERRRRRRQEYGFTVHHASVLSPPNPIFSLRSRETSYTGLPLYEEQREMHGAVTNTLLLFWSGRREAWPRMVPETSTVSNVFGSRVYEHYRSDLTLLEATARNDQESNPFGALLKEGTAALLNSYAREGFPYKPWQCLSLKLLLKLTTSSLLTKLAPQPYSNSTNIAILVIGFWFDRTGTDIDA
ncbi:hypothetical protein CR513_58594, partial [Mucuna pruriens]